MSISVSITSFHTHTSTRTAAPPANLLYPRLSKRSERERESAVCCKVVARRAGVGRRSRRSARTIPRKRTSVVCQLMEPPPSRVRSRDSHEADGSVHFKYMNLGIRSSFIERLGGACRGRVHWRGAERVARRCVGARGALVRSWCCWQRAEAGRAAPGAAACSARCAAAGTATRPTCASTCASSTRRSPWRAPPAAAASRRRCTCAATRWRSTRRRATPSSRRRRRRRCPRTTTRPPRRARYVSVSLVCDRSVAGGRFHSHLSAYCVPSTIYRVSARLDGLRS